MSDSLCEKNSFFTGHCDRQEPKLCRSLPKIPGHDRLFDGHLLRLVWNDKVKSTFHTRHAKYHGNKTYFNKTIRRNSKPFRVISVNQTYSKVLLPLHLQSL